MAKRFILQMLLVFCVICAAAGLKTAALWGLVELAWAEGWIYAVGSVGGLIWLTITAFSLRRRGEGAFDMVVAAEAIIAFGIFSLVLGLVMSLNFATQAAPALDELSLETLRPLTIPFLEGLCAAAVAPALATILRQYDALSGTEEEAVMAGSPVAGGSGFFQRLEALEQGMTRAVEGAERLATVCESGAAKVETALGKLSESTDGLGDSIKSETERLAGAAKGGAVGLQELTAKAGESKTALEALTTETQAFKEAAAESTTLLTGLADLIESVERFVKPDRKAS